jgi:hypothetical protein
VLRKKKRIRGLVLAVLIFLLLYLFFFPKDLSTELTLHPRWAIDLRNGNGGDSEAGKDGELYSFRAGPLFGYVDLSGNLAHLQQVVDDVALSDNRYVNYSWLPSNSVLKSREGDFQASFPAVGYPLIDRTTDRFFFIGYDSTSLAEVDNDGAWAWEAEFVSIITSLSLSEQFAFLGLMDGSLRLYDRHGELVYGVRPEGSRIPVVVGTSLSSDGKHLASITGLYPQILVVMQKKESGYVELLREVLKSEFRREVFMEFSNADRYLFFEIDGGLGVVDLESHRITRLGTEGRLVGVADASHRNLVFFLTVGEGAAELNAYDLKGSLLMRLLLADSRDRDDLFIRQVGDNLLLGWNSRLLMADMGME